MSESNQAQIDLWNGRVGDKWAAMQVSLDAMLAPATAELKARAGPVAGQRVLDIGCGTGETCTIWLGGGAEVTGVDVSAAMLAVAADRTGGKATLVQADASVWRGDTPFDLAVSQFGLMFFADPDRALPHRGQCPPRRAAPVRLLARGCGKSVGDHADGCHSRTCSPRRHRLSRRRRAPLPWPTGTGWRNPGAGGIWGCRIRPFDFPSVSRATAAWRRRCVRDADRPVGLGARRSQQGGPGGGSGAAQGGTRPA